MGLLNGTDSVGAKVGESVDAMATALNELKGLDPNNKDHAKRMNELQQQIQIIRMFLDACKAAADEVAGALKAAIRKPQPSQ